MELEFHAEKFLKTSQVSAKTGFKINYSQIKTYLDSLTENLNRFNSIFNRAKMPKLPIFYPLHPAMALQPSTLKTDSTQLAR